MFFWHDSIAMVGFATTENSMTPLFKKLHLADVQSIHVLNAPLSFDVELQKLEGVAIKRTAAGQISFALAFVTTIKEVEQATAQLTKAAVGDPVLWMVYPKSTSKAFSCEFNRDTGWQALGQAGYEPVSQVAIDTDWSALRFRKAEFIKTMRRHPDGALSEVGRGKARAQRDAS
jgi:hypothetical protein